MCQHSSVAVAGASHHDLLAELHSGCLLGFLPLAVGISVEASGYRLNSIALPHPQISLDRVPEGEAAQTCLLSVGI